MATHPYWTCRSACPPHCNHHRDYTQCHVGNGAKLPLHFFPFGVLAEGCMFVSFATIRFVIEHASFPLLFFCRRYQHGLVLHLLTVILNFLQGFYQLLGLEGSEMTD